MIRRPAEHFGVARPPLGGIGLVVGAKEAAVNQRRPMFVADGALSVFPRRPDTSVLSESIPLFFIGRNKGGFWVARDAEGRAGGIFLFKRSALRFAKKNSAPSGCATMLVAERFELDVENQGNLLVGWLDGVWRMAATLIPEYPPPIVIGRRKSKTEWR